MSRGGGHSSWGEFVQRAWMSEELAEDPSINLLETRAASESVLALAEPGDRNRLHIDIRTKAVYIRCQGGTKNNLLSQEALRLWELAMSRNITILTPHWIPTGENSAADFLSRHDMSHWEICWTRTCSRPSSSISTFNQHWMCLPPNPRPSCQAVG